MDVPNVVTGAILAALTLAIFVAGGIVAVKMLWTSDKTPTQKNYSTLTNVAMAALVLVLCTGGAIITIVAGFAGFFTDVDFGGVTDTVPAPGVQE